MGGHAWIYYVPYQVDIDIAMEQLKRREFAAGRYNPAQRYLSDQDTATSPDIGAQHASIAAALEASGAEGTRSILDMERVSRTPVNGVMTPLTPARVREFFGTEQPTREMLETTDDYFEECDRGQGIAIILYQSESPSKSALPASRTTD